MSTRSVVACYWAGVAGLTAAVLTVPSLRIIAWSALGLLAASAIGIGVRRYRPVRPWPWGLLAAAILISTLADDSYNLVDGRARSGLYVVANVLYLVAFVAAAAALLRFARSGSRGLEQTGALDAITVTTVLLLLIWVTWIGPAGRDGWSLADPGLIAYAIGDALLLATAVRLMTARRRTPAVAFLIAATVCVLLADTVNGLVPASGSAPLRAMEDVGWLLFHACWGAAALQPSMNRLTEPEVLGLREITLRRLWVVALTALVAPVILLIESIAGDVHDGVVLAIGGGVLTLLCLGRVAATANTQRRSLVSREHHDTLTGLPNRAHLVQRVTDAVAAQGEAEVVALLLLDLDDFRLVNDAAGHSIGDEVLVTIGRRLLRRLDRAGLAARFGGDEFAILIGPTAAEIDLNGVAALVTAAVAEPMSFGARTVEVTACIGVAIADDPATSGTDAEEIGPGLLRRAGLALQAAKEAGPGNWCRYSSEQHERLVERMRLRESLSRAVASDAFRLQFQPIVALDSGATAGFEALVRWEHPTRGLIAPSEFIALAEETGLIDPIGDLVLRRAVAAAAGWSTTTPTAAYVSVNVSARQLAVSGFADRVERVLNEARLPPSLLMLELTESVLMREEDHVWAELATLRDLGVRLAIDDFGTGFSSLSYLEQTPIDIIKIDKSFVGTLVASERQRTVVRGIVTMAETLGLQIVAEGVETVAERDLLAQMRCPYVQGYLYSVPLTEAEAAHWLTLPPTPPPPPGRSAAQAAMPAQRSPSASAVTS